MIKLIPFIRTPTIRMIEKSRLEQQLGIFKINSLNIYISFINNYSWFHKNLSSFSVQSFNEHSLSIPEYTGNGENRFQETHWYNNTNPQSNFNSC